MVLTPPSMELKKDDQIEELLPVFRSAAIMVISMVLVLTRLLVSYQVMATSCIKKVLTDKFFQELQ